MENNEENVIDLVYKQMANDYITLPKYKHDLLYESLIDIYPNSIELSTGGEEDNIFLTFDYNNDEKTSYTLYASFDNENWLVIESFRLEIIK